MDICLVVTLLTQLLSHTFAIIYEVWECCVLLYVSFSLLGCVDTSVFSTGVCTGGTDISSTESKRSVGKHIIATLSDPIWIANYYRGMETKATNCHFLH